MIVLHVPVTPVLRSRHQRGTANVASLTKRTYQEVWQETAHAYLALVINFAHEQAGFEDHDSNRSPTVCLPNRRI